MKIYSTYIKDIPNKKPPIFNSACQRVVAMFGKYLHLKSNFLLLIYWSVHILFIFKGNKMKFLVYFILYEIYYLEKERSWYQNTYIQYETFPKRYLNVKVKKKRPSISNEYVLSIKNDIKGKSNSLYKTEHSRACKDSSLIFLYVLDKLLGQRFCILHFIAGIF